MSASTARDGAQNDGLIASDIPGRLRVRLRPAARGAAGLADLTEALRGTAGVNEVETNPQTGSVMVRYDTGPRLRNNILSAFHNLGYVIAGATKAIADDETSPLGGTNLSDDLISVVDDLDRRLARATGQRADLRFAVPLGLSAVALWRIARFGLGLAEVPGFVWLWYTFDSFYKLNVQNQANPENGPATP
jgi:copper chaperone CopZ